METVVKEAENGNTIMSTIDVNIQKMVENRIEQWKTEVGSKQIGVVVMDPSNGEILAMATDKTYDLNNPRDLSSMYTQEERMRRKRMSGIRCGVISASAIPLSRDLHLRYLPWRRR